MPMNLLKTETEDELKIERLMYAKRYSLALDKDLCVDCELCKVICPREAIKIVKFSKGADEKAVRPAIDVDEHKCHYCGMCELICPFGAFETKIDGKRMIPVAETESFPRLLRRIEVDSSKCDVDCVECEKACPLNLIKVSVRTPEGEEVKDIESRSDKESLKVSVDIKKELCPCCRLCEMKCPAGAIRVNKIFHGIIKINQDRCPVGCQDCLDVCPITGALYLFHNGKVDANDLYCVFCGACKVVCPVEGALELQRKIIRHTPVSSGAWIKALEKLASVRETSKELGTKRLGKAFDSVEKRLGWRTK